MQELRPDDPAVIGPYRLAGRLGEGGMGEVFLGESVSGRRVAVKVVRPQLAADPGFRQRFRREIEAARRVGGFWTAPVVDADPEAAAPWVASAYVDAPDLGRLVAASGPLAEAALRRLAAGLAEALDAVHRAGLVHRDLKPSNVLVTDDGPRVIDFGISKAAEGATALTATGLVVGTPGFMSPEQASGGSVGAASDVFSLGAVLAFAATGEGPFGEGSVPALLYRVVHDEPRLGGVPGGLRELVARCLEKEPGRRPSAGELLGMLGAVGRPTEVAEPAESVAAPREGEVGKAKEAEVVCRRPLGAAPRILLGLGIPLTLLCGVGAVVTESPVDVFFGVPGAALLFAHAVGVPRLLFDRDMTVRAARDGLTVTAGEASWWAGWRAVRSLSLTPADGGGQVWHLAVTLNGPAVAHVPPRWRGRDGQEHVRIALRFPDAHAARVRLRWLSSVLVHAAAPGYVPDRALSG
ncbi:serine/threonine-protein kinase [Streptomyces sp. NK15101]|uniref:serine/threonine-protein kinase n=1 Tax=Streptomyces sp. NK15101 TaxID=2873261 RepID=UPI001CECD36B|nr:serine/threonine-protein kinase [Streptomyces sp. NK15101]